MKLNLWDEREGGSGQAARPWGKPIACEPQSQGLEVSRSVGKWSRGDDTAHAQARPPCPGVPACARTRGRSGNGAAGPRVRAASGSGCESGSGRLEPGAGRGPGLSVRRQRRRRRLGRRVQASGARSVGWWVSPQSGRARASARVLPFPQPGPSPLLP